MNFSCYEKARLSYRRTTGNVQISGFHDDNTYQEVVAQGARGLKINSDLKCMYLIVSGGLVRDECLQNNKPWTLGDYVQEIGGVSARGKKNFGIYVDEDEEEDFEAMTAEDLPTKWECTKRKAKNAETRKRST